VIGIDFYPTLLEITGTPKPEGHRLDGLSLVSLFKDPNAKLDRQAIFWHFPCYLQGAGGRDPDLPFRTAPAGAVRMGDWKLIEYFEDGGLELFNLNDDISEQHNLAAKLPEKAKELQQVMSTWRKQVHAPIPTTPNPKYNPSAQWKPKRKGKRNR
jgi:arylsulfatase A-like enzyme